MTGDAWIAVLESASLEAGLVIHVPAGSPRFVIGRTKEAALKLGDPSCARRHAALEASPDGFALVDFGSTNGVELNGEKVARAPLTPGDRFQIAETLFAYFDDELRARAALREEIASRHARLDRLAKRAEEVRATGAALVLAPEHGTRIAEWIDRARADAAPLALLVASVDDSVTRGAALAEAVRARYVFAMRLTDEHVGVLVRLAPPQAAHEAEGLRKDAEHTLRDTVSVGVASIGPTSDAASLVAAAFGSLADALASGGAAVGLRKPSDAS